VALGVLRSSLPLLERHFDYQKINRAIQADVIGWQAFCGKHRLKVAVLGTVNTRPIRDLLLPWLLSEGYWADVYEGNYGSWDSEPLDPESPVYAFQPDLVLIASSSVSLEMPEVGAEDRQVKARVESVLSSLRVRWQKLIQQTKARLIQHTFELSSSAPMGRLEGRYSWTSTRFIQAINEELWKHEGREVRLLDFHQLSTDQGRIRWHDPRWYHHSKHGFDPMLIRPYANALAGMLRALLGRTRKCLVTDLDNTLWGGVIGDDGIEGIQLGSNSATGEAYAAFQNYLVGLQKTGVVLAINSKNNREIALDVFEKHPECPLKPVHFSAVQCNWEPKSANMRMLARQLNLGLGSMVFVDDNPAECMEVRDALPEVTVIELSGDPAYFPKLIEERHLFTPLDFTAEDAARAASYASQHELISATGDATNLQDYLSGLNMQAIIRPALIGDLPRIEQLFRKTNQFNFTGRVWEQSEIETLCQSSGAVVLAAWLRDKHANHGLVSSLVAYLAGDALVVENWVMSCRVFTRTFEQAIFCFLMEEARRRGCSVIRTRFVATTKNSYITPLLAKLGFAPTTDGVFWQLTLNDATVPEHYVACVHSF
jgi:FkbH-like protein